MNATLTKLEQICQQFVVPDETLHVMMNSYREHLVEGLEGENKMLKCLPTFVNHLPSGQETGEFLLIDLGGTNLRIGLGILDGNHHYELTNKTFPIPDEIKLGSGFVLFDFIAHALKTFIIEVPNASVVSKVGFTFSFPVKQTDINNGRIIQFNKAFCCDDIIGLDAVELLQAALDKTGMDLTVGSLINDTVGTLMAHAYKNPSTVMSCILGTGTNGCYWERSTHISKVRLPEHIEGMLINIEWGGFGDGRDVGLPLTEYDHQLNCSPKKHTFEKMVSGMYLGELFRMILADFGLLKTEIKPYQLDSKHIAICSRETMTEFLIDEAFDQNIFRELQKLAELIMVRSARLCAALIAATYKHSALHSRPPFVIAVDGSLYTNNAGYQLTLRSTLDSLLEPSEASNIILENSSGEPLIGSGIVIATFK